MLEQPVGFVTLFLNFVDYFMYLRNKEPPSRCQRVFHVSNLNFNIFIWLARGCSGPVSPGTHSFPGGSQAPADPDPVDPTWAVLGCGARTLQPELDTTATWLPWAAPPPHAASPSAPEGNQQGRRADGGESKGQEV